ncbi:MAG TPA: MarR family transcriptional regulator [Ilumatobacter sp.]|nr:MarR family transcriptional regulator [Ilumatobacter sp.]
MTLVDSPTEADGQLIATLRGSVLRLGRRLRLEHDGDLTVSQLSVLGTIVREGPLTIGELATHERVKPPSATRTVTSLEDLGLLSRSASDDDGRHVIVALTDAGAATVAETRRLRDAWLRERLTELSAADRRLLEAAAPLLDRLAQS